MDTKSAVANAGVMIVHNIHEGKHYYEVENVVKYKKRGQEKMFVRKGDKLMQINNTDLQDLKPEELAQTLANGNAMLTVHKAGKLRNHTVHQTPDEDALQPVSRESTVLNFCWEMKREEDLEAEPDKNETGVTEENICEVTEEESGEGSDLLVIKMTKTSIAVVSGRGCDRVTPCQGCHNTGCTLNDVVMVAESSTVTLIPRGGGGGSLKQEKLSNVLIEHVASHHYIRGICSQKTLYASPNPERITIYYYKSNVMEMDVGMPVVLNITGSNCFLHCSKDGDKVLLQMETCEKRRLQRISKSDNTALSYVFYMKADRTKQRRFESALHRGWFINVVDTECVAMANLDGQAEDPSFLFIIRM
ncbi:interleukin-1 family member A [Mugil cephalus]|uniref:interleukin-1 family member A n=1 Tax=Mugil cephalus TaxID=48193 RepID=UPI001FB6C1A7|nr:interleukin-1 family member A [Mugil cephalus]